MESDIVTDIANKPKKKGTTMKTRKSLSRKQNGDYGDSDDEDYWSKLKKTSGSKKAGEETKARVAASKAKIAQAAAVFDASENEDAEEEPRRNRISLNAAPSEGSDPEIIQPAPKAKAKATSKVASQVAPKKTAVKRRR